MTYFCSVLCRENSTGVPKKTQVSHMFCYDPELDLMELVYDVH